MGLAYADLETAKASVGTRLVVTSLVPSPWSEAAEGCLHLAKVPALVVRRGADKDAIDAWTGVGNVPALLHDREPVRSGWAAIVTLVDRIARAGGGPRLLPDGPAARAEAIGVLHEIAGEDGIGWNARLAMIHAGITGDGSAGFPPPVAKFLAKRYAYTPEAADSARDRIGTQLAFLAERLGERAYFGGDAPNAVDVYSATFLTPVVGPIDEAACPAMAPPFRVAFASAHAAFGVLVPSTLRTHRERMFASHLPWPIEL